jgi:hypothetical protein
MADDKLGKSVTINWNAPPLPVVGAFYRGARFAYLIGYVRPKKTRDGVTRAKVRAMRIDPETIPAGITAENMSWEKRDPK